MFICGAVPKTNRRHGTIHKKNKAGGPSRKAEEVSFQTALAVRWNLLKKKKVFQVKYWVAESHGVLRHNTQHTKKKSQRNEFCKFTGLHRHNRRAFWTECCMGKSWIRMGDLKEMFECSRRIKVRGCVWGRKRGLGDKVETCFLALGA